MADDIVVSSNRETQIVTQGAAMLASMSEATFETRLAQLKLGKDRVRRIQHEMMTVDEDFGIIPGTKKPTLLKPGAETLCQVYSLVPTFAEVLTEGNGETTPHLRVKTKCYLHVGDSEGPIVGEGIGAANSWERRYRYRAAGRACPSCGVEGSISRSRFEKDGDKGWWCSFTRGGCGAQFRSDEPQIAEQEGGMIDNPDPFDIENTLYKMSEKRAYVNATLRTTATSGLFTQDLEDNIDEHGAPTTRRESARPSTATRSADTKPSEPAPASDGSTLVQSVTDRSGIKNNKPWKLYTVTFTNGQSGTTFDAKLADLATTAASNGTRVIPILEKTDKGTNLKGLETPKPVEVLPPDEPVSGLEKVLAVRRVETAMGPRWICQTDRRQLITDQEAVADILKQLAADKGRITPSFEVVAKPGGGSVNRLIEFSIESAEAVEAVEAGA